MALETGRDLVLLLIERGAAGATLREVAELDPRRLQHVYDSSDFDSDRDQSDRVWDLGPRGIDREILESAARMVDALPGGGAVLEYDKPEGATLYDEGSRIRLIGWSGLPARYRLLPTLEELSIPDPVERAAAFLLAGGRSGRSGDDAAYWSNETAGIYTLDAQARCWAALGERGWDIRNYRHGLASNIHTQVAATPAHPMRPPADVPPDVVERDDYHWPAHSYRFSPSLWEAIRAAEAKPETRRNILGSFTGGSGAMNPLRSYGSPAWYGEPVPDGEATRRRVVAWAERGGHEDVLAAAVPGSVELILADEPVGAVEIAARLGVRRATVDQWGWRGLLPEPDFTVGGRPAWRWGTIEEWARRTGRMSQPSASDA